jgi:hypothetical protein
MHVPIKVKSPNNISQWQMGFNSAFKGLTEQPKNYSKVEKILEEHLRPLPSPPYPGYVTTLYIIRIFVLVPILCLCV